MAYQGFFQRLLTKRTTVRLAAKATPLTLFVGAGASIESGVPLWSDLLGRMLRDLERVGIPSANGASGRGVVVDSILEREDLLAAAELIRAHTRPSQFEDLLIGALYRDTGYPPAPGESHRAIARLAVEWMEYPSLHKSSDVTPQVDIITTNYDILIEAALYECLPYAEEQIEIHAFADDPTQSDPIAVFSVGDAVNRPIVHGSWFSGRSPDYGDNVPRLQIRVIHLHGVVMANGRVHGRTVLSERDYYSDEHLNSPSHTWQRSLMLQRLDISSVVFIGAGLSDPLLLSHLHAHSNPSTTHGPQSESVTEPATKGVPANPDLEIREAADSGSAARLAVAPDKHWIDPRAPVKIVFLTLQQMPWLLDDEPLRNSPRFWRRVYERRWQSLGISVIWADFYSQQTQYLREVAFVRQSMHGVEDPRLRIDLSDETPSAENLWSVDRQLQTWYSKHRYGRRLDHWHHCFRNELPAWVADGRPRSTPTVPGLDDGYGSDQVALASRMQAGCDVAFDYLRPKNNRRLLEERWKLDLWIREPSTHSVVRYASTEYLFKGEAELALPISLDSQFAVVRAFTRGSVATGSGRGRWKTYVAIPIRLSTQVVGAFPEGQSRSRMRADIATWGGLPVGFIVVSSSVALEASILKLSDERKYRNVMIYLQQLGQQLLTFADLADYLDCDACGGD